MNVVPLRQDLSRIQAPVTTSVADAASFLKVPLPEEFKIGADDSASMLGPGEMAQLMIERAPFFFIERAIALVGNEGCHTVWGIAPMTVERSAGHFPGRPIVPLIELCKAMAQTGIVLVSMNGQPHQAPIAISAGASKALAKELIDAPVQVLVKVVLARARLRLYFVDGVSYIDGKRIGMLEKITYTLLPREELEPK